MCGTMSRGAPMSRREDESWKAIRRICGRVRHTGRLARGAVNDDANAAAKAVGRRLPRAVLQDGGRQQRTSHPVHGV